MALRRSVRRRAAFVPDQKICPDVGADVPSLASDFEKKKIHAAVMHLRLFSARHKMDNRKSVRHRRPIRMLLADTTEQISWMKRLREDIEVIAFFTGDRK